MPRHRQLPGQLRSAAHHVVGALVRADAAQQSTFGLPDLADRAVDAVGLHVVFDPVGGAPQGQLAQGHEVALAEEVLRRPFGLRRQVDLARGQPLDQFVGRGIDQHDLVGTVEEGVWQRLVHHDAGDAADHVVEALEMLNVERAVDVDAGCQQFLDVLPALGVARTGEVGMRQFVHQDKTGPARQGGIEIELGQASAAVIDQCRRQHRQAVEQRRRLAATVGLDHACQHVDTVSPQLARRQQHREGLAHACRRAEVDAQLAAALALLVGMYLRQQGIRIGAWGVGHGHGLILTRRARGRPGATRGSRTSSSARFSRVSHRARC
jgi:hypothetical protein